MKTLKTIQALSRLGKVLSTIAFICSIVGCCICIAGLIALPLRGGEIFKLGGVTIYGLLKTDDATGEALVSAALSSWPVVCAGEAVLAKFAEHYFKNELKSGTPFTAGGARELKRLGILTIAISCGCAILADIVQAVAAGFMNVCADGAADIFFDNDGAIALGIMFIVMSLLCRHGAEINAREPRNAFPVSEE